jgi:hypothetical protein
VWEISPNSRRPRLEEGCIVLMIIIAFPGRKGGRKKVNAFTITTNKPFFLLLSESIAPAVAVFAESQMYQIVYCPHVASTFLVILILSN